MLHRLPLFPLNLVLFPGTQLPLHIFEPRYRLMINRCIEEHNPFGVVLIREGVEVGGMAVPYLIGTLAKIQNTYRLADGRIYIVVEGTKRFRINHPISLDPYIIALVTELEDEETSTNQVNDVLALYAEYHRIVSHSTGMKITPPELPDDPIALSYRLANTIQLPLHIKQGWLEANLEERLREISHALQFELSLLPPLKPDTFNHEPLFEYTTWN